MPSNVTGAFQLLGDFLKEETLRIKEEDKQYNIRKTIDETAKKFAQLGPDARPQEVRNLYLDSIRTAMKNDAAETVPLIANMMTTSALSIKEGRELTRDTNLAKNVGDMYGTNWGDIGGAGAVQMAGLKNQTDKWVPLEEEKQGSIQQYSLQNGRWNPRAPQIITRAYSLKDKARWDNYGSSSGAYNFQQTTYTDANGNPVTYNPRTNKHYVGGEEVQSGEFTVKESNESTLATREKNIINSQVRSVGANLSTKGATLAALLRTYDFLPDDFNSSTLKNLTKDEYRDEAYSTIAFVLPEIESKVTEALTTAYNNAPNPTPQEKKHIEKLERTRKELDEFTRGMQTYAVKQQQLLNIEFGDAQQIIDQTVPDPYKSPAPNTMPGDNGEQIKFIPPDGLGKPEDFKGKWRKDNTTGVTWYSNGSKWEIAK